MNNWEKVTLGEIIISANTGLDAIKRAPIVDIDTGIKCIRIQDISQSKKYENWGYTNVDEKNFKKFQLKQNDIIIARTGATIGVNIRIKNDLNAVYNNGLIRIRVNNQICNPIYLYYNIRTSNYYGFIDSISGGTSSQPNMQINALLRFEINLPPLDEQKRIADVLSALDDKIEINNKINENLEAQAQAIFKQWFVDFEFPDQEGKPYKTNGGKFIDSELGEIPLGWKIDSAENIFDISIGKTPPRKEPIWFSKDKMDVTWVSISDMGREGVYISNSSEYLTRDAIKKFNVVVVPENTVLLSFKLTVGRISITDGEVTTNEAIAHFKTNNKTYTNYIYQYLKVYDYQSMGNTSSIANAVNSKIIKVMKIILPSDNILKDFYDIVNPIMMSIKRNEQENKTLSELRDSLLIKLMSGEVRV
ncbi:MAG: restriction endonuclease subunit S [Bacteroidales bacterium]|nr:restriction endonuclease subunit S [Bacteroidales bacterium]